MATVIAITSGKKGVGKTNIVTNLALALASRKSSVCIIDADSGLATVNILLDLSPGYTLEKVLNGEKSLADITLSGPSGISVIRAASGIPNAADPVDQRMELLTKSLTKLENTYDYIIIDAAAGVNSSAFEFIASAVYKVMVITPDPSSLSDSFLLLKRLSQRGATKSVYILVNMVTDYQNSRQIFTRFQDAVKKYLNIDVQYLGYLILDKKIINAVIEQTPIVTLYPESPVSCCFHALADVVKSQFLNDHKISSFIHHWETLSQKSKKPGVGKKQSTDFYLFRQSGKKLVNYIEHNDISSQQAIDLMKPILEAYVRKIHKASDVLYPAMYNFLANKGYPETEIKDLVFTLESIFEKAHGKPLRSNEHMLAKMLADAHGSEHKMRILRKTLEKSFERQFKKKLYDPINETVEIICREDFSKQDFADMLELFKHAYKQQFNIEYTENGDKLIAQMKSLLTDFKP